MNSSVRYAIPTMEPVKTITLFITSICSRVIYSSSFSTFLVTTSNVCTMANPEKMAPATKYGGKMVVCQPGTMDVAQSKDTMVCTDSISAVLSPANTRDRASCRCQCLVEPVQPKEVMP